ncbi:MAG: hypothetical protein P9L99_07640 [Candidatus Lernaella stagnicola]|nr:hypothetical protein [Candidatus Lernaella stagnicola]
MNIRRRILFVCFLAVLMLSAGMLACDSSGDDDDEPYPAVSDDDNDDHENDDDLPGSLDDDDDDDNNDDDDTTPAPTRLLLIGESQDEITSWLSGEDSWEEMPMPQPLLGPVQHASPGPSLVVDGEYLTSVWNVRSYVNGPSFAWQETDRHRWLHFDPDNGWRFDEAHEPVAGGANVGWLALPATGPLWLDAYHSYSYFSRGFPHGERYEHQEGFFHAVGSEFELAGDWGSKRVVAAVMPEADFGVGCAISTAGLVHFLEFDGGQWTSRVMPPNVGVGLIEDLLFFDRDHGYALFDNVLTGHPVKRWDGDQWTRVEMPAACLESAPVNWTRITGRAEHLIAYTKSDAMERRFAEYRDGEWSCRTYDIGDNRQEILTAQVLDDGTAFLVFRGYTYANRYIMLRVEADGLVKEPLPPGLTDVHALHVFGEHALPRNYEHPDSQWGY